MPLFSASRMDGPVLRGGHQDARLAPHGSTGSSDAGREGPRLPPDAQPAGGWRPDRRQSSSRQTRDQPAATPANARTQDARPRTVDVPDASPASGRDTGQLCAKGGRSCGNSGQPPDDRQARGHRTGRRRDPAQGAGHPERAGDGPAASSQASHREDARQPPGGCSLATGGTGHAPEHRQTSGADALAERHTREGMDRPADRTAGGGTWLTSGRPSRSTPRRPCAGG